MHTLVGRWLFFLLTAGTLALGLVGPAKHPGPVGEAVDMVSLHSFPSSCRPAAR